MIELALPDEAYQNLALCNFPFRSYPAEGFPGYKLSFLYYKRSNEECVMFVL